MTAEDDAVNKQDAKKINDALEMLNEAAHGQKKEFTDLLTDKYSELKKAVHHLESDVSEEASEGLEKLESFRETAVEHTKDTVSDMDRKVHESPWISLGVTLVSALAIGVLLGRKD